MLHDFINWIREDLGRFGEEGQSWSHQLHESLFMWNIIEGTHVLTIMFFAGTIWMIDLRMMGIAFKNMPLSKLSDRVLPINMAAFAVMIVTGIIAFVGRDVRLQDGPCFSWCGRSGRAHGGGHVTARGAPERTRRAP